MTTEDYEELETAVLIAKRWSFVSWMASALALGLLLGGLIFRHPDLSVNSIAASLIALWAEVRTHN